MYIIILSLAAVMARWQQLSVRGWKDLSAEEVQLLEGSNASCLEYRLSSGVPVRVDFVAKQRTNLASRRLTGCLHCCFLPVLLTHTDIYIYSCNILSYSCSYY